MVGVERYAEALATNGHSVEKVRVERVNTKLGYVVVSDAIRIDGERFEGELLLNLYADDAKDHPVELHGVDVHSRAGESFSHARESLLDEYATTRQEMGNGWVTWTYHSQADVEDNLADLQATYRDLFDDVAGEAAPVSPS